MMGPWIVGLSLFLTTSTSLRVKGYPVGPGELMLALWIAYEFSRFQLSERNLFRRALLPIPWFWMLYAALLLSGWLFGIVLGRWDSESGVRNVFAMFFVAIFSIVYIRKLSLDKFSINLSRAYIFVCGIILGGLFLFSSYFIGSGDSLWTANNRFIGLSLNPNQVALSVICVPFLYLCLGPRGGRNILLFVAVLGAITAGIASGSDALFLSWAVGIIGFFALSAINTFSSVEKKPRQWFARGAYVVILLGIMFLFLVSFSDIVQISQSIYNAEGNQGSVRFTLWRNAVDALRESPWIGFGPGAYSGYMDPFEGQEAHNVILDLVTNTGLIGAMIFLSLIVWAMWCAVRSRRPELFGGVCALFAFSMFHYTLRHPVTWFYLITLVSLSISARHKLVSQFKQMRVR